MGQRNMRFVLEEGNALTFHDKDGNCIGKQKGLVPEGHSLLLSSEDLSYITYGPSGFHYKRYNPNTMAIDRNTYDIPTEFSASQYEDRIAMAAYCPRSKKAFFITISKKTREIQVWEDDDPNAKTVEQTLPLWRTLRTDNSKSATINLNKDVSLESSYVGEGNINYTAFFSGKDSHGYWQFAIDIPKQNTAPQLVRLDVWGATVSRLTISQTSYFGTGVDPSTITQGQGGYVRICTPVDGIGRGSWDSSDPYDKYMRTGIKDLIHIFSILIIGQFIVLFLIYVAAYPDQFNLFFYFEVMSERFKIRRPDFFDLLSALPAAVLLLAGGYFLRYLPKYAQRLARWNGEDMFVHNRREKRDYDGKLARIGVMLDFYQVSSDTLAILREDKVQFYSLESHRILERKTVFGTFKNSLFLKQRTSFSTHFSEGTEVEKCDFLVIYAKNNTELQFKICDINSGKIEGLAHKYPLTEESLLSLKTVLINYDDDAYRPYDLGRVNIHHTTTPMRLNINLNDGYDPNTDQHSHIKSGQMEFYTRLHGSPKNWSSIQQISNLIELIHGPEKKHEIVFELDDGKTLVHENKSNFFDRFSEGGFEGTHQEDEPLRMKRGDKELAPNLETALFLSRCIEKPVAGFSNFDKNFPNLMKMLWVGESDQRIHQGRQTFNLEDDLPAMSYIHNKLSEFKGRNPKQNVELWKNWEQNLPSWELAEVLKIIEKKVRWPRVTYSHQMMHGDLRPSNVVVNAGREVWSESFMDVDYWYDLFLCDFPDLVAKQDNGELLYRTESVDGTPRVTSHFFNTMKPPKINPMLDLSRFFAYLLVQVPFEPSKQEKGLLAIEKRNRRTRARESRKEDDIHARVRQQLERALVWAERELRDLCFLAEEGTEDTWRELLKAMIFDQCLQIMMHWKRDRSGPAIEGDLGPEDLCWIFYNVSTPQPVPALTFLDKARDIAAFKKAQKNNDDNLVYMSATENKVKMNAGWEVNHVHPKQAKKYNQPVPERYREKPWNKEVVKLSFSDWELNLDPESTTLLGLDAAQTELPGLLADAMENGFPADSLHQEGDHKGYIRFMDEYSDDYAWECRWKIKDDVFTVLWILEA